jgi:V/A-type H+-transporting ATPase subunit E
MEHKIQEITEKIYHEGVERGNEEAVKIVEEAKHKASNLIEKAKKEAESIISEATAKAFVLNKNTRSELQMASNQLIASLEQEIASLVNGKIVEDAVNLAIDDKLFMQQLIVKAVESWASDQNLKVFVAPAEKSSVENFFAANAKGLLDKGLVIETANNVKAGFQIGPVDGSYKVSFTREDFIRFFTEFLRPKVVELLFDQK